MRAALMASHRKIGIIVAVGLLTTIGCTTKTPVSSRSVHSEGPIVNQTDRSQQQHLNASLLHAVEHGNISEIANALALGADINARDDSGFSALVNAIAYYQIELIEFLVNEGAVTNRNILRMTSELPTGSSNQDVLNRQLRSAVINHDLNRVKQLIGQGANINAEDDDGFTILVTALASYHLELVDYLIARGAMICSDA